MRSEYVLFTQMVHLYRKQEPSEGVIIWGKIQFMEQQS